VGLGDSVGLCPGNSEPADDPDYKRLKMDLMTCEIAKKRRERVLIDRQIEKTELEITLLKKQNRD
jgi:hypothetical protein